MRCPNTERARTVGQARPGVTVRSGRWQEPAFEHAESTVADLARAQAEGRLTARALTEAYLARIEAIDRSGPRLNSVIELNPDALAIADALDAERGKPGRADRCTASRC